MLKFCDISISYGGEDFHVLWGFGGTFSLSLFRTEDEDSMFLLNGGISLHVHTVCKTQKGNFDIYCFSFEYERVVNAIKAFCDFSRSQTKFWTDNQTPDASQAPLLMLTYKFCNEVATSTILT